MGLKIIAIQYFQMENKMADLQNIYSNPLINPVIGLQTDQQLNKDHILLR